MLKKIIGKIWKKTPPALRMRITRATQCKFTVSVAVMITNENGELLMLDHVLRPTSNWGIPGGFLDYGEQPPDAARRELLEETGIELTDLELLFARTIRRHVELLYRAKTAGTPEVKSPEINAVGWFRPGELPQDISRAQHEIIERFLTR